MTEGSLLHDPRPARPAGEGTEAMASLPPSPASSLSDSEGGSLAIVTSPENSRPSSPEDYTDSDSPTAKTTRVTLTVPTMSPESPEFISTDDQVAPSLTPEDEAKGRSGRFLISPAQQAALNNLYSTSPYPQREECDRLSQETGLSVKSIKQWFQNKRAKGRKMPQKENTPMETANEDFIARAGARRRTSENAPNPSNPTAQHQLDCDVSTTKYQPMTQVSLPPDHPFCQLMAQCGKPQRRARRPNNRRAAEEATTPVARPPNARSQGKVDRRRQRQRIQPSYPPAQVIAPIAVKTEPKQKPTTALWRPMALPTSSPAPARAESPLDLSVTLKKRKRDDDSPTEETRAKRSSMETLPGGRVPPILYPAAAFGAGYYGQLGQSFMPSLPPMPYGMSQIPFGLYGQPTLWGQGMPRFASAPNNAL